ncbi:MAG TPA: carboxypeptidase-like regulatory domain-containing protein [Pyrinomonadaceae bacterium]|nr:carboxypeptidase-like regulatory domain-containing protein [Pyrinomonadaceae bacterium]
MISSRESASQTIALHAVSFPSSPQSEQPQVFQSAQGRAYFFINSPAVPTAANVSISGRVLTANGNGLRNAAVYLTKPNGETVTARTSAFGYYCFDDLEAGQTVAVSIKSRLYQFTPQIINLTDNLTDVDFIAMPE